jgi:hypothetical protein
MDRDGMRYQVYQLLADGRWLSPGTPASSTTKAGRHDIAEILLKVEKNLKISANQKQESPVAAMFVNGWKRNALSL